MTGYYDTSGRYKTDPITGRKMDTQMHPRVIAAQEAYAKTREGKRDEVRARKIEEQNTIHAYLEKDDE